MRFGPGLESNRNYRNPVRKLWIYRDIDAPSEAVWELLTNTDSWPAWGPSVRRAELHGDRFETGATGTVTTVVGLDLSFVITHCTLGRNWSWRVAGVTATAHTVRPLDPGRCRAEFGVPWTVAPYLLVCRVALTRVQKLAESRPAEPVRVT